LKEVLSGETPPNSPTWRGNADKLLKEGTFSVVTGTRDEATFNKRMKELNLIPRLAPVKDYATGLQRVEDGRSNAFFGSRATLLDAVKRKPGSLEVLDRLFTHETLAFAIPRGDEDFRLLVDSALSRLYRSNEFGDVYGKWFGPLKPNTLVLFQLNALQN
jgi:polar amino acid transport system substrate-binding protein